MPMTDDEILAALRDADAIRTGHFVLTSGRHSGTYVQCARVLEDPELTTRFARIAVERLPEGLDIDLVAAPAVGGLIIGFAVAQALGVKFIFSERENGAMVFRRAFEVPVGARVLVVEDVVTTGGSVAEVIDLVEAAGGRFASSYWPLLTLEVESWEPDRCGLCEAKIPVYSPGSRRLS